MAGHFVEFTVFLMKAEPPAFFLREVIFDRERDDRANAGEGVRHHGDDGGVAQTHYG